MKLYKKYYGYKQVSSDSQQQSEEAKAAPKVWKLLDTAALRVSEAGLGHTAGPCYSPVGHNLTKHQHQTRSL